MSGEAFSVAVSGLGKTYRIWQTPAQRLLSPLCAEAARLLPGAAGAPLRRAAAAGYRDFHALQDISFEVRRGEAVAILGRNGSGKSTLLQLIAGTLQPTQGTVQVSGRVTALLELGAGFNTDFTGRENILLSGALLGLSQKEMEARFDDIAAFADIGDFIEQPVKTYSSGMTMRLAFAVNTCVDPDVLIVDEALSVGDAPFQAKCFRRLRQLIDQGVSLLFVSHDLGTVRSVCSRALWLKNGKAEQWGEAKVVAKEYEKFCWQELGVQTTARAAPTEPAEPARAPARGSLADDLPASFQATAGALAHTNFLLPVTDPSTRMGNGAVVIEALCTTNAEGSPTTEFGYNDEITLHYRLAAKTAVNSEFMVGIRLRDPRGHFTCSIQDLDKKHRLQLAGGETVYGWIRFRLPLTHGDYILRTGIFGFADGLTLLDGRYDFSRAVLWDVREDAMHLRVRAASPMPLAGPVHWHAPFNFWVAP